MIRKLAICTLLVCATAACERKPEKTPEPQPAPCATYSGDVAGIVTNKCAKSGCHVEGFQFGNLSLYAELKERVDNGRIQSHVFDLKIMPPTNQEQLTQKEKDKIKCWMDDGAPNN